MTKFEALQEIFGIEEIEHKLQLKKQVKVITAGMLLAAISKESYALHKDLGISAGTASALVKYLFPDKPSGNQKLCTYLLHKYGSKYCSRCKRVYFVEDFSKNISNPSGYNTYCKGCYTESTRDYQREYQRTRKALKMARMPAWADRTAIQKIYSECPRGYHVDHIIPLQGELVSGLHVENNLQYLTAFENLSKHNKFTID